MTVYSTPFDPATKLATAPSIPTAWRDLDEAVAVNGPDYLSASPRVVVYPGVAFSTFPFKLEDKPCST